MTASSAASWSIGRTLAFLAAVLAIGLGAFVPVAVAASADTRAPIVLCSGGRMQVVYVDDQGQPTDHGDQASLTCAMALLSGMAATPVDDPVLGIEPAVFETGANIYVSAAHRLIPPARAPPRPPSTAPPHS